MRARAHELKGMSGNFGFSGVGNVSGFIEKAARNNDLSGLQEQVGKLGQVYVQSKSRLTSTAQ